MAYKSQTLSSHSTYSFLNRYVILADSQAGGDKKKRRSGLNPLGRGIVSFALFVTLFVGILLLFGMGMSRLGSNSAQTSTTITQTSHS